MSTCFETGRPEEIETTLQDMNPLLPFRTGPPRLYMPMAADKGTTAKMTKALRKGGKGLGEIPSSFYDDRK